MESKETQVNILDPQTIQDGMEDLRHQLARFNLSHEAVNVALDTQHSGLKHMQDKLMNLGKHFTSFMDTLFQMQDRIENNKKEIKNLDDELEQLTDEREQLEQQQKEMFSEERFHDISKKLSEGSASLSQNDVETETRLKDFAREDLLQRMDDLNKIKNRVVEKNLQYSSEWNGFKDDVKRCRSEKKSYVDEKEHLNSLMMSRLRGLDRYNRGLDASDNETIQRTIRYLQLEKEFKERQEKFVDAQIVSRDLQDEISSLLTQRNALWKQNEKFEQEIDHLQPEEEKTGFLLHQSERHQDLPQRDEFTGDNLGADIESVSDSEINTGGLDNHFGGKMLHRCSKITNIPLVMKRSESVDPTELMATVSDEEDTSLEQSGKDEESEKFTENLYQDKQADTGYQNEDDENEDDEEEDEDDDLEGDEEEPFLILDDKVKALLPSAPAKAMGLGLRSPTSGPPDKEDNEDDTDSRNHPSGSPGPSDQPNQQSKLKEKLHGMADAPADAPASMISKIRGRLGAPSTSSKNLLESHGIAAGAAKLAKQSSAKFGESTFTITRRARRK